MTGPIRKRCRRYDTFARGHFITFSCFERQPFLTRPRVCQWLADAIVVAQRKHSFDLWAYVFMPEHVHLLILPTRRGYHIRSILASIKLPPAQRAVRFVRRAAPAFLVHMADRQPNGALAHRLWQRGGGHDRNLTSEDETQEKLAYIHFNPVKRKLVTRPQDWQWSSAGFNYDQRRGPLELQTRSLPWNV